MQLKDFIDVMERIAPPDLKTEWDNIGLLIGTHKREIKKVLVALDCTMEAVNEAIDWGADLLLTHHPLFLQGVSRILPDEFDTAAAHALIRANIAHYAAHTNLDAAHGGVNDSLAARLGLFDVSPLLPDNLGRIGSVEPVSLSSLARRVQDALNTVVRFCGDADQKVRRIATVGGSGGDYVQHAAHARADVLITGEIKHHQALKALYLGLNIIEAGHYETESVALLPLIDRLQHLTDDVQYKLTRSETSCLRGV